jgi:hypothetical protein
MDKGLFLGLVAILILSPRPLDAQIVNPSPASLPDYSALLRAAYKAFIPGLYRKRVEQLKALFFGPGTHPLADGGSSGDGSSGDSSGDGTGDSGPGSGDTGSSDDSGVSSTDNSGDPSTDPGTAATDPGNTGDPDPDPSVTDNGIAAAEPSDPTDITALTQIDFAFQQAYDAVVNPFGGDFPTVLGSAEGSNAEAGPGTASAEPGSPGSPGEPGPGVPGAPGGPVTVPGGTGPLPPTAPGQDVAINAVIVSGAESPWDAIAKAPGVRNVTVTGGVIALGGGPAWLKGTGSFFQVFPDRRLLNGSVIPPVVPNVIDIRIMNCPVEVVEDTANSP